MVRLNVLETIGKLSKISKTRKIGITRQNQISLSTGAAWWLWDQLTARYDIIETLKVLSNFAVDKDLLVLLDASTDYLEKQVELLEEILNSYGIPLPLKPPDSINLPLNIEIITDRYIFRRIYGGMQGFLPMNLSAFMYTIDYSNRQHFKQFLVDLINQFDKFTEYGKEKGWLMEPPTFRT